MEGIKSNRIRGHLFLLAMIVSTCAYGQSNLKGLPQDASKEALKWQPTFAFTHDSCYPSPAISPTGQVNSGLNPSGDQTGQCRTNEQLKNANTYYRSATIRKGSDTYAVHMYALYFMKDQAGVGWNPRGFEAGHRHDWEFVLVWTKNGQLTHASFSRHGNVETFAKADLQFDRDRPNSVRAYYFKDKKVGLHVLTRSIRPARMGEAAHDPPGWKRPALVQWDRMKSDTMTNEAFRTLLNLCDFGKAVCPFKDDRFQTEIAKNPPPGYPDANEWRRVPNDPPSPPKRNYSQEPPKPDGLVARWRVYDGRAADRDNRVVNLPRDRQARIVVHLLQGPRERFQFTLKHDKRRATDRSRTELIQHDSVVRGDAHNWPGFRQRIYLGNRQNTKEMLRYVDEDSFFVDLVLVPRAR